MPARELQVVDSEHLAYRVESGWKEEAQEMRQEKQARAGS